jgi:aromatic-L-amino-acid decarboxylase
MVEYSEMSLSLGDQREAALARTAQHVLKAWREFDAARERESFPSEALHQLLTMPLPNEGSDVLGVIDQAAEVLDSSLAQSRPRYFAFIGSSGLEVGALADLLAHSYDSNLAVDARAATDLEWQAVSWLAQFIGFPAQTGTFTSGGTISNITALAAARESALPGAREHGLGGSRPTLYCSVEAHYSITRAAEVLGIGAANVRALDIDAQRRMRADVLREQLQHDVAAGATPLAIVATTGTTLTGAVDPIEQLADVAEEFGVWLHVDGAYGVPAAAVASRAPLFAGLDRVNSVTVDCHKWMFVPKACSAVLVRDAASLAKVFAHDEAYMPHAGGHFNAVDITLEYSRPFRALKLWMLFSTHGANAVREAIERNCDQAEMLFDSIQGRPPFETLNSRPQLSIVPFRAVVDGCSDPDVHNAALCTAIQRDGRVYVSPATIDGHVWLRPCFTNFRTTSDDVAALLDVAQDLGEACDGLHR